MEKARVDCNRMERVVIYLITIGMILAYEVTHLMHIEVTHLMHINIMSDPSLLSDSFAFAV